MDEKTGSPLHPPRSVEGVGKSGERPWSRGPWVNCGDAFIQSDFDAAVIVEQMNTEIGGDCTDEEITANANLIAAAPDLYEALDWFARGSHYDGCAVILHGNECDCGVAKARAALAKARGESPVQIRDDSGDDAKSSQADQEKR